jgi:LCP family protein required for cell wall assembly
MMVVYIDSSLTCEVAYQPGSRPETVQTLPETDDAVDGEGVKDDAVTVPAASPEPEAPSDGEAGSVSVSDLSITPGLDESWENILLLGTDAGTLSEPSDSDAILICSVNKNTGAIRLTSVMRDSEVMIEGKSCRLSSAYYLGGAKLAMRTVNECFGMNISKYVAVDFSAFAAIAEKVGGIETDVTRNEAEEINRLVFQQYRMLYMQGRITQEEYNNAYLADILKANGEGIHLSGMQTLAYARIRKQDGDFGRAERQRAVLNKLMVKLKGKSTAELLDLAMDSLGVVRTNMDLNAILTLAQKVLAREGFNGAETFVLPVRGTYTEDKRDGETILRNIDFEANQRALKEFIYAEPYTATTPAPAAEATPAPATEDESASLVWVSNAGLYYHTSVNCSTLSGLPRQVTLENAIQRGNIPCPECYGEEAQSYPATAITTLYATEGGRWYHSDQNCQGMTGAVAVTEASAIKAGKTACPVCIGYYATEKGKWYHCYSNCQGMTNAVTKPKAEWEAMGKTACPVCMSSYDPASAIPKETQVFATQGGSYFHTKNNCSGMKGASQIGISTAVKYGKTACPTCVKPANIHVFARKDGTYYHTKATCSGMKSASYVTAQTAIKAGKKACPSCNAKNLSGSSASSGNTGTATTTKLSGTTTKDTNTYVYATKAGKYCHTNSTCSGMTGATKVTLQTAINAGKKACPTCFKAGNVNVFATTTGKYYHTKSNCSGMTNALTVTVTKAKNAGKTACPTCAKQLGSLFDKKTTTNTNNNNTNTNSNSATASSVVYIKTGSGAGAYYHKAAKCTGQGFTEGTSVTLEYALSKGYKACPSCKPPSKIST